MVAVNASAKNLMLITPWSLPGLKNIYRTVAVFLWIFKGCPDRMMRLAFIRVGSGLSNEPIATSDGA